MIRTEAKISNTDAKPKNSLTGGKMCNRYYKIKTTTKAEISKTAV